MSESTAFWRWKSLHNDLRMRNWPFREESKLINFLAIDERETKCDTLMGGFWWGVERWERDLRFVGWFDWETMEKFEDLFVRMSRESDWEFVRQLVTVSEFFKHFCFRFSGNSLNSSNRQNRKFSRFPQFFFFDIKFSQNLLQFSFRNLKNIDFRRFSSVSNSQSSPIRILILQPSIKPENFGDSQAVQLRVSDVSIPQVSPANQVK
jgi:hypothetical protein